MESIVAILNGLMNANVEELRIIQTMLLLVTSTDVVQGKSLTKVCRGGREGVDSYRYTCNFMDSGYCS